VVVKLSGLFALDSFAGGFVVQSFATYWFYLRFGVHPATLGVIFFRANVFAATSALLASRLATRWGLVNTMVLTHPPSNILLILVQLIPTSGSAAAGITGVARTMRRHQPFVRGVHVCAEFLDQRALLPRWHAENSVRSLALQGIRRYSSRRGTAGGLIRTNWGPQFVKRGLVFPTGIRKDHPVVGRFEQAKS
jgi:hypothetical protein